MEQINHLAVIAAALSDLLVGALWYSPVLFFHPWMKANNFSMEDLQGRNQAKVFTIVILLSLVISYNLAFFLAEPGTTMIWGLTAGLLAGVWAAAAFTIVALFEQRNAKYIFINCGYILLAFSLKGLIIGAWR